MSKCLSQLYYKHVFTCCLIGSARLPLYVLNAGPYQVEVKVSLCLCVFVHLYLPLWVCIYVSACISVFVCVKQNPQ